MAKPRVFVSSTYFDLRHIRNSLENFIEGLGYEAVLFESGDIVFRHDKSLDDSCYHEIQNCHILVLIVGGRYGSPTSETPRLSDKEIEEALTQYNSITRKEYETARDRDIPVFIFVEKGVLAEYQTFKENRDNLSIKYAHVNSVNIFRLLDDIIAQRRNNFVRAFESFDDISNWLRDQWAGLFSDFLSQRKTETSLNDLGSQLSGLRQVVSVLKEYSESIMRKVQPEDFMKVISEQDMKLRNGVIQRFSQEILIDALYSKTSSKDITLGSVYDAFEASDTFDKFLEKAGFVGDNYNEFLSRWREDAEKEFAELKIRYNSGNSEKRTLSKQRLVRHANSRNT